MGDPVEIRVDGVAEHGERDEGLALKKRAAKFLLQRDNGIGQRGLGNATAFGRAGETTLLAERQKVADLVHLHVPPRGIDRASRRRLPSAPVSKCEVVHTQRHTPCLIIANSISCNPPLAGGDRMQFDQLKRRVFITLLGGAAAAWPLVARAQQQMPLVGFLNSASPDTYRFNADSFREGLAKAGFVEGRNLRIEERWARSDYDALPTLAAELVAMGVVAIAATGDVASARAAQRASNTVPVVFTIGGDPVRFGLVKSLNRPGGHVTGILFNQNVLGAKRVELLREIAPNVSRVALLMNPTNPNVDIERLDAEAGARKLGLETITLNARNAREIDTAFEQLLSPSRRIRCTDT